MFVTMKLSLSSSAEGDSRPSVTQKTDKSETRPLSVSPKDQVLFESQVQTTHLLYFRRSLFTPEFDRVNLLKT